jgi:hypothetical protein
MQQIKVKYQNAVDYKIIPVSGATGSITPQGKIVCNLFYESSPIMPEAVLTLDEKTNVITESPVLSTSAEKVIDRTILIAFSVDPEIGRQLGIWLIKQADAYGNMIKSITNPATT